MRSRTWLWLLLLAASCSSGGVPPGSTNSKALTVHEWGTFTSLLSSAGKTMEGLHHEEEALPAFVHSRSPGDAMANKGLEIQPTGVNQKLETPVLYFYSQAAQAVKVHVDFPEGVVSQWYPDSAAFQPAIGAFSQVAGGAMEWQAQLQPGMSGFPTVAPDDIWAPSRKVASVPVQIAAEREQFIFYRGLGTFQVPFHATAATDGTLSIKNESSDPIANVFLLRLHPAGGAIIDLGALNPGQSLANIVPPVEGKEMNVDQYVADASTRIAAALVKSGLYADEARAMVDTWSRSYFRTQGLRFLYVVPRTWTDKLLPLTVEPKPVDLVRTLVGRVEVLTPDDETQLVSTVQTAASTAMTSTQLIASLGRFAEPKLRRASELVTDPNVQSYLAGVIAQAQQQP